MINKIFQSSNLCLRKKETSARGIPRCFDVCYLSRKSRSFFGGLDSLYSLEFKICGCALRVFLPTTYSFNCFWSIFFSYRFVFLLLLLFRGGRTQRSAMLCCHQHTKHRHKTATLYFVNCTLHLASGWVHEHAKYRQGNDPRPPPLTKLHNFTNIYST